MFKFKLFSIEIILDWTLFLAFIILAKFGPMIVIGLYLSVLAHELCHVRAANYFGISCKKITLYVFGGAAHIDILSNYSARKEFFIALAGPLSSFAIAIILIPFSNYENLNNMNFLTTMCLMNFMLAIFNLLPLFPMDGGRILRSSLSFFISPLKANKIVFLISICLGILLMIWNLMNGISTLFFIIPLMIFAGYAEIKQFEKRYSPAFVIKNVSLKKQQIEI